MKIAKDYIEKETEAMLYGTLFHEAAYGAETVL
jgi:hypothetical protein